MDEREEGEMLEMQEHADMMIDELERERDAARGEVQRLLGELQQLQVAGRFVLAEVQAVRATLSLLRGSVVPSDEVLNALINQHRQAALEKLNAEAAALRRQADARRGLHAVPAPAGESFTFRGQRVSMNEQAPPDVEAAMRAEAKRYADADHLEAVLADEEEELDPDLVVGP